MAMTQVMKMTFKMKTMVMHQKLKSRMISSTHFLVIHLIMIRKIGRVRYSEQIKIDTETFGDFSRHRGGWGGRGERSRGGGYYGRGYGYGYAGRGRGRGMSNRP
ncbi:hypothetical protein PIB30_021897 [Stylosanthes scabra]|uniref:TFG box profile domain-containing protein n=1 Tax=Stylosanthes scabra TaxID=79078 RepID=A0ABU6S9R8_9FABA|nr:hypothetical protein [Stylosanthes scabra]